MGKINLAAVVPYGSNPVWDVSILFAPFAAFLTSLTVFAAGFQCDLTGYRPLPGLTATRQGDDLVVAWDGEGGAQLSLKFGIASGQPMIRELAVRQKGKGWAILGRDLVPTFACVTGRRRGGRMNNGWDVFWDAPLQHPEEVRRFTASFNSSSCQVRTDGQRLEISFDGATMGIFSGLLQYTVYRGSNLIRQEAIMRTDEPDVAYIYSSGLRGFSTSELQRLVWLDTAGNWQAYEFGGAPNQDQVPLRAKHRTLIAEGKAGSLAAFPPPHQFFFPREQCTNLGYVWYRKDGVNGESSAFSFGVRQHHTEESSNERWVKEIYPLYNAPPGTRQRMSMFFYASAQPAEATLKSVLAYTHGDRFKELPGYKTMATHFHFAFAVGLLKEGMDVPAPFISALKALGVNIAFICDFHGDGHPQDPGPLRLQELEALFEGCRRFSDRNFLILPGEEANAYLGGHWNLLFPKPVYWFHVRPEGAPFTEKHPKYGTVYRTSNAEEVYEMIRREKALVWQTHPRTKGSTGYPDKIKDAAYFRDDAWLGAAWKALPADLSAPRLGDRAFRTLDDMNNWGNRKFLIGEVDTYKMWPEDDAYGHLNVNYVKLERLPGLDDWSTILEALRSGDFFVTTGEVLIRSFTVGGRTSGKTATYAPGQKLELIADLEWTFPLDYLEIVWGDGQNVARQIIPATDTTAFGSHHYSFKIDPEGKKWVRLAAWDVAGNGAFTQPVFLQSK